MAILLYLILFLLPVGLGKHFVFSWSYLDGVLVDYWVPTIYLTDILIGVFIALGFYSKRVFVPRLFYLLLALFAINILVSIAVYPSLYFVARVTFYLLFCIIVFLVKKDLSYEKMFNVFFVSTLLLCVIALLQWFFQGSLFDNYLFLGEQPYNISTPGVLKHVFLDNYVVPPYALFRHPNILGGYLSIMLIWFAYYVKGYKRDVILTLGVVTLFLTFSYVAWIAFALGMAVIYTKKSVTQKFLQAVVLLIFVFGMFGMFNFSLGSSSVSVNRRFLLIQASAASVLEHPFFGTGLNTNVITGKDSSYASRELNFFQPVHNIFWLILSEGGFVLFSAFVLLFLYILATARYVSKAFFATLLQFIILGSFDHYLITISQTLLLFMLTLCFSIAYTLRHEV